MVSVLRKLTVMNKPVMKSLQTLQSAMRQINRIIPRRGAVWQESGHNTVQVKRKCLGLAPGFVTFHIQLVNGKPGF